MRDFLKKYNYLLDYSEFKKEKIIEKYRTWHKDDEISGDGHWEPPVWMFDPEIAARYAMLVYIPESPISHIKDIAELKLRAIEMAGVPDKALPLTNNLMIGDMATRIFREFNDFDYELLVSAKEAVEVLMEVVRKPIDTRLQDDKERNAIKAKRECYDDAKYMLTEIKKLSSILKEESPDVSDHVENQVFKKGMQEKLAEKAKKT
jgi:hypothetical protein